jgi:phage anti-repressor protein
MSKDLINNIKNNWSNLLNYIYNNLFFNTDNDFQCIHLITDINYDYNYITFSLIYINNSKNVYILLSDHQDGVYNRLINKNN